MVQAAVAHYGRLDILLNNAGISLQKLVEEAEPDEIENIFGINVFGHLNTMRHAIPIMRA